MSFVVRVNGLAELQHKTAALEPKLALVLRRILGLASETERLAIRDDLHELAGDVAQLAACARGARNRGVDPNAIDEVERKLADTVGTLAKLRQGLRHANTLEELQALAQHAPDQPTVFDWHDDSSRVDIVMSPAPAYSARWNRHDLDRP